MADLEHFPDALPVLVDGMPGYMPTEDATSEVAIWLAAIAEQLDEDAANAESVYADAKLSTATPAGLVDEWAHVYGLGNEINSGLTPDQIRGYIEAWVACDGSIELVRALLLAIITLNPANNGGTVLTFPGGGGGLTFPAGGGLTLYQYATVPDQTVGFTFPADGSGLRFPDQALYFGLDGTGIALAANWPAVPDLAFPNSAWVVLTENFFGHSLTVTAKSYLAFDRGAFLRAVDRFRQADTTVTYTESNT